MFDGLIRFIVNFYNNGIYYPNIYLVSFLMLFPLAIILIWDIVIVTIFLIPFLYKLFGQLKKNVLYSGNKLIKKIILVYLFIAKINFRLKRALCLLLINEIELILLFLAFITLATRFAVMYFDQTDILFGTNTILKSAPVGIDIFLGTVIPAFKILSGQNFYYFTANYGPSFSLLTIPLLYLLRQLGLCSFSNFGECSRFIHLGQMLIVVAGFLIFILYYARRIPKIRNILILFLLIFFVSAVGTIGLRNGNLDIILSLLLGVSSLLIVEPFSHNRKPSLFNTAISVFCMGIISNSKIFLIPVALGLILVSKRVIVSLLIYIATFTIFSYLPNLFNAPSSILDPFRVAIVFEKSQTFIGMGSINFNHSFQALGSLFTNCIYKQACHIYSSDVFTIRLVSKILFFIVFVLPFLLNKTIINASKKILTQGVKDLIELHSINLNLTDFLSRKITMARSFIKLFNNLKTREVLTILFLSISVATINLWPTIAYTHRLYYSVPLLILLIIKGHKHHDVLLYTYLSMIFLILKGQYLFINFIADKGFDWKDARAMSYLVIPHFFFLIRGSLSLCVNTFLGNTNGKET